MDRKVFFALMAFSFVLFVLYLVYTILAPFFEPIGWAAVIGVLTFPLYKRLHKRFHGRDLLASGIMTPMVVLTMILPVVGLAFSLVQEATAAYRYLEEAAAGGGDAFLENLRHHPFIAPWVERLGPFIEPLGIDLQGTLIPALKKFASMVLEYATGIVRNFFVFAIKLLLMLITLFFVYRDGERILRQFWSVIPLSEAHKTHLAGTVQRVISAVIFGIFMTCLVQGVLGGIGFWVAGLHSPVLFGALMAICALIPVVGTALVWLPGAVYLLLQGEVLKGVGLIVWGVVAVGSIDNVIRPIFISGRSKIPVIIIALGVLGGVVSFGLLGVVMGPMVLALFIALFDLYREEMFPGSGMEPETAREE
ncbi:MAG: hypothetical protein FD174_2256 [Geobacteraceae bacterium]|nr:MAG: hypothetical protein FD174_2256 [Geobacteraceae bacterium]